MPTIITPTLCLHCDECKKMNPVDERICIHCGHEYSQEDFLNRKNYAIEKNKNTFIQSLIVGVFFGIIFVFAFIIF